MSFSKLDTLVRAGAGAGKTTNLTKTVFEFAKKYYNQNNTWPKLMVTTFTRKATQELRERLLLLALEDNNDALFSYVSTSSKLQIQTLHGVFSKFLLEYASLAGMSFSGQFISDSAFKAEVKADFLNYFFSNDKWLPLLDHFKLDELLEEVLLYFLKNIKSDFLSVSEEDILNDILKLRKEFLLSCRLVMDLASSEELSDKWISFIDKVKLWVDNEDLSCHEDWYSKFLLWIEELPQRKPTKSKKNSDEFIDCFDKFYDFLKQIKNQENLSKEYIDTQLSISEIFFQFAEDFKQWLLKFKSEKQLFTISDIEPLTSFIISLEPGLANDFSNEWDFWLIDEYQDTSPLQVSILNKLIGEASTYIVGDPQQSIYLFRGARTEVFNNRQKFIENKKGGSVRYLQKNFRSEPELLEFFNDLFSYFSYPFEKMQPKSIDFDKNKVVSTFLKSTGKGSYDSLLLTTEAITNLIENQKATFSDITILARTHNQLESIYRHLQRQNIPCVLNSKNGFSTQREVRDALVLLKFLLNQHDNKILIELLRNPVFSLADEVIASSLQSVVSSHSYWNHLKQIRVNLENDFIEVLEYLENVLSSDISLVEKWEFMLKELYLIDLFVYQDNSGKKEANLWKLYTIVSENIKKQEFDLNAFLNSYLTENQLNEEDGKEAISAESINAINLMTIHASKGLKFNHVILTDCHKKANVKKNTPKVFYDEDKLKVSVNVLFKNKKMAGIRSEKKATEMIDMELQEQDRLFYVALTRAVYSVSILWNDKIEKNSWLERCLFPIQPGLQAREKYSYRYLEITPEDKFNYNLETLEDKVTELEINDVNLNISNTESMKTLKKVSVSKLILESSKNEKQNIFKSKKDIKYNSIEKVSLGIWIHKAFELYHYGLSNEGVQNYFKHLTRNQLNMLNESLSFCLEYKDIPFYELIKNGNVEWGYQYKENQKIIEGQIDLWGEVDNKTWIVDYKTGDKRYLDKAFLQLEEYEKAVSHVSRFPIKKVVVFPLDQQVYIRD